MILFDACTHLGEHYDRCHLDLAGKALGLEVVPVLASGTLSRHAIEELVNGPSCLGGAREGVVIKPQDTRPGRPKAKLVGDA